MEIIRRSSVRIPNGDERGNDLVVMILQVTVPIRRLFYVPETAERVVEFFGSRSREQQIRVPKLFSAK
jgi:hypothetical protein